MKDVKNVIGGSWSSCFSTFVQIRGEKFDGSGAVMVWANGVDC